MKHEHLIGDLNYLVVCSSRKRRTIRCTLWRVGRGASIWRHAPFAQAWMDTFGHGRPYVSQGCHALPSHRFEVGIIRQQYLHFMEWYQL